MVGHPRCDRIAKACVYLISYVVGCCTCARVCKYHACPVRCLAWGIPVSFGVRIWVHLSGLSGRSWRACFQGGILLTRGVGAVPPVLVAPIMSPTIPFEGIAMP
eukprot:5219570-Alexandrium_andersonii.AAC.1